MMLLMACTSEETVRTADTTAQRAVGFGSYTQQFTTRSGSEQTRGGQEQTRSQELTRGEALRTIPEGGSMGVYAYLHNDCLWSTDATPSPNFMWNQKVTFHEPIDFYEYTPLKYWPNEENDKVSFIAYYPYCNGAADDGTKHDIESTGVTPLLANDGTGLPSFDFTVKDAAASQADFLVSDLITDLPQSRDTEGDPGTSFNDLSVYDRVKFLFRHALAKVEFRIVADADIVKDVAKFRIPTNGLSVTNVAKSGRLTVGYDASDGTTMTWSLGESPDRQSYYFKTYEPLLLMPQTLGNDVKMLLDYEVTFKSDGTSYHYDGATPVADQDYTYRNPNAQLQLNEMKAVGTGTPITKWEANHHYIYIIRLRAHRIEFTGQVVEWGETVNVEGIEVKTSETPGGGGVKN